MRGWGLGTRLISPPFSSSSLPHHTFLVHSHRRAVKCYQKAVDLQPSHTEAAICLGDVLFAAGDEVRGRPFVMWGISEFDSVLALYDCRRRLLVLIRELLKLHQPLSECACRGKSCELTVDHVSSWWDHVSSWWDHVSSWWIM